MFDLTENQCSSLRKQGIIVTLCTLNGCANRYHIVLDVEFAENLHRSLMITQLYPLFVTRQRCERSLRMRLKASSVPSRRKHCLNLEAHKPGTFLHCIDHNDIKTDGTQLRNVQKPSVQQSIPVVPPANSERDTLEQSSKQLLATATPSDTFDWLLTNRFNKFVEIFTSFSGEDMLRMSRDDLVQICGQADGIRLYNVLHLRPLMPKLKIYVRVVTATHLMDDEENRFGAADGIESMSCVYNAIYLSDYSYTELQQKISVLCNWPVGASDGTTQTTSTTTRFSDENEPTCYSFLYLVGPQSIRIQVTDDVVRHLKDESMYTVNVVQEQQRRLILLLKC